MSDTPHQVRRLWAEFTGNPLAMLPQKVADVQFLLAERMAGRFQNDEAIRAAIGGRTAQPPVRHAAGSVALLPFFGICGQRMNMPLQMSGGTSTEMFAAAFQQLLDDDTIGAIVMAVDSPGGSCHGTDECATTIRAARGRKPTIAVVSSLCASAAFWIASQCDRVVCTPGGDVGSIGVITAHEDISAAQDKLGVRTTLISAGKHKADGHPFAPLTDEARSHLQHRVDECYRQFVGAVAAGRGVNEATVREGYGQGRLLSARDALACGMVDEIATLDDTLADVATRSSARAPGRQSRRATRQDRGDAVARQEPAVDDWQRSARLRLLDL